MAVSRVTSKLIKSDKIWRNLYNYSNVLMKVKTYKQILTELPNPTVNEINECIYFTPGTFKSYSYSIMNKLITDSYMIFKEKDLVHDVDTYNLVIKSYIVNKIDFDYISILKEIKEKNLQLNAETYSLLILYLTDIGKMSHVEILMDEMRLTNVPMEFKTALQIVKGYIIAGDMEKSENFITNNNLEKNHPELLIQIAFAYASLGNCSQVLTIIDNLKEYYNTNYFINLIYLRLAKANAPESDLEQIFQLMADLSSAGKYKLILDLNRLGLYEQSFKLFKKIQNDFFFRNVPYYLILSYNSNDCPVDIYKSVLKHLVNHKFPIIMNFLFDYVDYDSALTFTNENINDNNRHHFISSLLARAVKEKSINLILKTIKDSKLPLADINEIMYFTLIPSMLDSKMASDCLDILFQLKNIQSDIFRILLLHCLSWQKFSEFKQLKTILPNNNIIMTFKFYLVAIEIINNYKSFQDIHRLVVEASTVFCPFIINDLLFQIVFVKIIASSEVDDVNGINEALKLVQNFNVTCLPNQRNKLMNQCPNYKNMIEKIPIRNVYKIPR